MSFKHVKALKGSDLVMEDLKEQIASNLYPPGSKLPTVVELAASYSVGRSTIREALSGLKATGWVDIRHGGGTYVRLQLPKGNASEQGTEERFFDRSESFLEVLEVRKFIEVGCATLAAQRRTEQDMADLGAILKQMKEALGDEEESDLADIRFHLRIAEASHNSLLVGMMTSLAQRLQENMKQSRRAWFFAERDTAEGLLAEHRSIYEAICDGDAEQASKRMMQHLLKVDQVVQPKR